MNRPSTVSLFCGAGGESVGKHLAFEELGIDVQDMLTHAINHWELAVATHGLNLPWMKVHQEDITQVTARTYGLKHISMLWASPSCIHHSRARGGKPREEQQRSHAWEVIDRWLRYATVDVMLLENVPEFQDWGPLDQEGKPIRARKGEAFRAFVGELRSIGYQVEWRVLCAADYGDPTTRRRFFLQAARDGHPVVWPEPTHRDPRKPATLLNQHLPPWRAAAECIDWGLPCPSIFDRKRPLADATMRRIATGVVRFVLQGKPFLVTCNHSDPSFRGQGVDQPVSTVTAAHDARGVVVPEMEPVCQADPHPSSNPEDVKQAPFLANTSYSGTTGRGQYVYPPGEPVRTITGSHNGHAVVTPIVATLRGTEDTHIDRSAKPATDPLRTVSASGSHHALVTPFVAGLAHDPRTDRNRSPQEPLTTIHAGGNNHALAAPCLVQTSYGERKGQAPRVLDLKRPLGTVVAGGQKHGLVASTLIGIDQQNHGGKWSVADPPTTATTKNRHGLVAAFLSKHYGGPGALDKQPPGLDPRGPAGTVTAQDKHSLIEAQLGPAGTARAKQVAAFIVKYYGTGTGQKAAEPMHTIRTIAHLGLVTVEIDGASYVVTDIGLRMLEPRELALAMGFPSWYRWEHTDGSPLSKRDAIKLIGNACPVNTVKALIKAVVLQRPRSFGLAA